MAKDSVGLTHLDARGNARMVDIAPKDVTEREAVAECAVHVAPATLRAIVTGGVPKGDVFATARIAAIQAAKRTHELIPLCHPLKITRIAVEITRAGKSAVRITATVKALDRTGVEMEALTAASVAALTIYDMCKALQRDMEISGLRLLRKRGGKSGEYRARGSRKGARTAKS